MLHKTLWTPQKISQRITLIQPLVYRQQSPLPAFHYKTLSGPLETPPVGTDVDTSGWEVIQPNSYWGDWNVNFVLTTDFTVPDDWKSDKPVALYLPLGDSQHFSHPEALAYIDGESYASADRHHQEILLPSKFQDGKSHRLTLHGWTGRADDSGGRSINPQLYMRQCSVVQIDEPTREFAGIAHMALEVANQLDENEPVKGHLYNVLDEAFKVVDTRDPLGTPAFYDTVPAALKTLKDGIKGAGAPMDVNVIGIGHAHIDVAWLWTLGQTVRKSGRTFSNVLRLMEQFPEYKFSQSQAQLYSYTEQYYPEIFKGIKDRVKDGRWEVMGGTWVEPDCNAIGPESLARQFLLGRTYFRKHFGDVDTGVLWLPDTFGYSWALPQLIKQAGMKYFITHKMSWNQYNAMPNQFLWWQGLDGTKVFTHFLTTPDNWEYLPLATTYNGDMSARQVMGTWTNFRQKETYNELITAYGYGDGGGGPTREMIENTEYLADHPGMPHVRPGTVREFMDKAETEIGDGLPVWNGEFYLEYHRGTFTGQARTKRRNRKSEFLLHDVEFLAAWAAMLTDYKYPEADVAKAWELICLNQFHDILPGSSIGAVYEDNARDFETISGIGERVRNEAITALASKLPANTAIAVANPTSFGGTRVGRFEGSLSGDVHLTDASGKTVATQAVQGGATLIQLSGLEAFSVVGLSESAGAAPAAQSSLSIAKQGTGTVLENALLRVEVDAAGDITRIYDKEAGREVLAEGEKGNALLAFEDRPMNFDAWDIDIFYEDRTEQIGGVDSIEIVEQGPVRVALQIKRTYRNSKIDQKICLYADSKRIDFGTWVDWHDHHILLKAAFPVNVMSPMATFDVQWGNVQRATHRNTSWEMARFETCAQKWADLSEGNYGVAVLNDCKYGYDIHDSVIRLSLLKSATSPDPMADQGEHLMTYSLLPHTGDWREEVIPAAYDLNDPLIIRRVSGGTSGDSSIRSLVSVSAPYVVIETIKQAEDGNGIIVRLYEDQRNRGTVTIGTGFALAQAYHCNLLEENEKQLKVEGNQIKLDVTPYQIATLRLVPHK